MTNLGLGIKTYCLFLSNLLTVSPKVINNIKRVIVLS